jgi:hypothetical protein
MKTMKSFYAIGICALIWNLIGDAAYIMQVTLDTRELARTDPYTARIFAQMPVWAWSAYATAVWGGTLATLMLLMKRAIAIPLYILSLAAIVMQFSYAFLGTDMLAVRGWTTAIFPAIIFVLGLAQLLFALRMRRRGVLR